MCKSSWAGCIRALIVDTFPVYQCVTANQFGTVSVRIAGVVCRTRWRHTTFDLCIAGLIHDDVRVAFTDGFWTIFIGLAASVGRTMRHATLAVCTFLGDQDTVADKSWTVQDFFACRLRSRAGCRIRRGSRSGSRISANLVVIRAAIIILLAWLVTPTAAGRLLAAMLEAGLFRGGGWGGTWAVFVVVRTTV